MLIDQLIERAAAAGFVLVKACDLLNEETRTGENAGSSGVQQTTANGISISNGDFQSND